MEEEVLKEGLSIEELEERAEFSTVPVPVEAAELGWCEPCAICTC